MEIISQEYQTPVSNITVPKEIQGKAFKVSFEVLESPSQKKIASHKGLGTIISEYFKDVPPPQNEDEVLKIPDRKADMALERPPITFD